MRQGSSGRRPRGRPHRKQHLSPRSQTYDSSGPEGRVRGNAHQIYEKYLALARDATASGDRIAAEGFYQFAEHYYRLVNDSTDPHRDGPRRAEQGRDSTPARDEAVRPGDGSAEAQPAVMRGNGVESDGDGPASKLDGGSAPRAASESADTGGEEATEPAPRRRGLRRRKPAGGNGASAPGEDGGSKELAPSDSDSDSACP